jgi:hypothetical protein
VLRFIEELARAGVTGILPPRCPRCDRAVSLSKLLDGQRVCRNCFAKTRAVPCSCCSAVREPAARDADGGPLFPNCLVNDPANLEDCTRCSRRLRVAVRTAHGPVCQNCRTRPLLACSICGREKPCEISRATGQPWCENCQNRWRRCSACGTMAAAHGGTRGTPLCASCVNPGPGFWDRCPECHETWVLSPRPCQRCVLARHIRRLLGNEEGQVRPDLAALLKALTEAERPDNAIAWVRRPRVREILAAIGSADRAVTHDELDEMPSGKTLAHLRSILVATGTLPERDERLVRLERRIREAVSRREDPGERRVLHAYATWHHLRRLRQRLRDGTQASRLQDLNVRCHVTAAANFLDWLADQELTLAACTQGDLDRRNSTETSYPAETAHFIRWAVKNRHARDLTAGAVRWAGPSGPHGTEKRWDDARRLLHDGTLAIQDRVAGLLLLLYAQRIAAITKLTTSDISDDGTTVAITLGKAPLVLPPPLDGLVRELAGTRRGHAANRAARRHPVAVRRRPARTAHHRRSARRPPAEHRPEPSPGQVHCPVRPRCGTARRYPGPHARHPHLRRCSVAARRRLGLDGLRSRRRPQAQPAACSLASRSAGLGMSAGVSVLWASPRCSFRYGDTDLGGSTQRMTMPGSHHRRW